MSSKGPSPSGRAGRSPGRRRRSPSTPGSSLSSVAISRRSPRPPSEPLEQLAAARASDRGRLSSSLAPGGILQQDVAGAHLLRDVVGRRRAPRRGVRTSASRVVEEGLHLLARGHLEIVAGGSAAVQGDVGDPQLLEALHPRPARGSRPRRPGTGPLDHAADSLPARVRNGAAGRMKLRSLPKLYWTTQSLEGGLVEPTVRRFGRSARLQDRRARPLPWSTGQPQALEPSSAKIGSLHQNVWAVRWVQGVAPTLVASNWSPRALLVAGPRCWARSRLELGDTDAVPDVAHAARSRRRSAGPLWSPDPRAR